jgi:hypothetical protein
MYDRMELPWYKNEKALQHGRAGPIINLARKANMEKDECCPSKGVDSNNMLQVKLKMSGLKWSSFQVNEKSKETVRFRQRHVPLLPSSVFGIPEGFLRNNSIIDHQGRSFMVGPSTAPLSE